VSKETAFCQKKILVEKRSNKSRLGRAQPGGGGGEEKLKSLVNNYLDLILHPLKGGWGNTSGGKGRQKKGKMEAMAILNIGAEEDAP